MAQEIRIVRGNSIVLSFSAIDIDTELPLDLSNYEAMFSTENYDKTSVANPLEVRKDYDSEGNPIILVFLKPIDNDPAQHMLHYNLKIYKAADPTIITTGATGDLRFITE